MWVLEITPGPLEEQPVFWLTSRLSVLLFPVPVELSLQQCHTQNHACGPKASSTCWDSSATVGSQLSSLPTVPRGTFRLFLYSATSKWTTLKSPVWQRYGSVGRGLHGHKILVRLPTPVIPALSRCGQKNKRFNYMSWSHRRYTRAFQIYVCVCMCVYV